MTRIQEIATLNDVLAAVQQLRDDVDAILRHIRTATPTANVPRPRGRQGLGEPPPLRRQPPNE